MPIVEGERIPEDRTVVVAGSDDDGMMMVDGMMEPDADVVVGEGTTSTRLAARSSPG